uniref:MYND-type domain-containing protein n=1 Tax=Plectus sambesii TaxID=2011161 RepID=A0A914W409_9BILA
MSSMSEWHNYNKETARVQKTRQTVLSYSAVMVYACAHCGQQDAVLRLCGNCRSVVYCNVDCQRADWGSHRKLCKQRNPGYFDKTQANRIRWFTELIDDSHTDYEQDDRLLVFLIDTFCVRCLDEAEAEMTVARTDIMNKFTRYLYAAKGANLLPQPFTRSDIVATRHDAFFRFRIDKIYDNGYDALRQRHPDFAQAVTDMRNLHLAICGPIKFPGSSELNLI